MGIKHRPHGRFDVELQGRYVKRVHDEGTAVMLYQSGLRLLELGKPLPEVIAQLRGDSRRAPTFGVYAKAWLASNSASASSVSTYRQAVNRVPKLSGVPMDEIDLTMLKRTVSGLKGYSAQTVRQTMMVVKAVLSEAAAEGLIASPPTRIKTMPRPKPVRPGFALTRDQHAALVAHSPERYRTLFALWPYLGLRVGEAIALRWTDVDLAHKRVNISRQVRKDGSVGPTKNGKRRHIDLITPAVALLEDWPQLTPLVFPGEGGFAPRSSITAAVSKAGEDAGVKAMHSHVFRHTFGSWLLEAGAPITYVAARMGDTPSMALSVYAHDIEALDGRGFSAFEAWASGDEEGTDKTADDETNR